MSTFKQAMTSLIEGAFGLLFVGAGLAIGLTGIAAWFTHIARCFHNDQWGFLIAGALFFPIALVHGVGIWLGFF